MQGVFWIPNKTKAAKMSELGIYACGRDDWHRILEATDIHLLQTFHRGTWSNRGKP